MNHHHDWLVSPIAAAITGLLAFTMTWWLPAVEALAWGSGKFMQIGGAVVVALQMWLLIRKLRR